MTVIVRRKAPNPLKGSKGFKPGQSGNPKGRVPGSQNKVTLELQKLYATAASDLPIAYEGIRQNVRKGKEWAIKVNLELAKQAALHEIQHVHYEVGAEKNADLQIAGLLKALSEFKYFTKEQLLNSLDTLTKIKNSKSLEPATAAIIINKTSEELDLEIRTVEMLIRHKQEEEERLMKAEAKKEII